MSSSRNSDGPPHAERRPVRRRRVLLGGVAVHQLRRDGARCQVRDLTEKGARIAVSHAALLPDSLHLIIIREQIAYEARVIWREGDMAGLAFSKAIDLSILPDPTLAHLQKIWAQQKGDYLSWR
jgi:hypothetical protein